jgi:hypothetical protein
MDTERLLNDVDFASDMLAKPKLSNADMVFALRNLLKMKYYPVAVKYFFSNDELNQFKRNASYKTAVRPLTLCQFVAAPGSGGTYCLARLRRRDAITPNMLWDGRNWTKAR